MDIRSLEDVKKNLKLAKLEESDLKRTAQSIFFSNDFSSSEVSLIELPPDVVLALKNQEEVCIRGRKDDNAILCTESKSYTLKEAEVSNSLLLSPNLIFPDSFDKSKEFESVSVNSLNFNYFELKKTVASKRRIEEILRENPFSGKSSEKNLRKYSTEDLMREIQASERELIDGLREIKACEIDGFWRILDIQYTKTLIDAIINFKEENSWQADEIDLKECKSVLGEIYPEHIIEHIIQLYLKETDIANIYSVKSEELVKFFAVFILINSTEFNLKDFLNAWKQIVPEDVVEMVKANLLNGIALVKDQGIQSICYFPLSKLPEKSDERFLALFNMKEKWKFEEILPYIRDLDEDEAKIISILNKNTRVSHTDGIKLYSYKKK